MQISDHIHYLKIPFKIPVGQENFVDRFVNIYLIFCKDTIVLVDTGVSGSSSLISKYLELTNRSLKDIGFLILTHSHPDHIGDAINIQKVTGCRILAHKNEREWIENIDTQFKERPIPGFYSLLAGSVKIDALLEKDKKIKIDDENLLEIYSTPGHSSGSISIHFPNDNALICGDAVPVSGTLPIFEDYFQSINSIEKLKSIPNISLLLSAWDEPRKGNEVSKALNDGIKYLEKIYEVINKNKSSFINNNQIQWIDKIISDLGLEKSSINPLVVKSFISCLSK